MKNLNVFCLFLLVLISFDSFSQRDDTKKSGLMFGFGSSWISNNNFDDYYTYRSNLAFNMIAFQELNSKKLSRSLFAEFDIKYLSSQFRFNENFNGIVSQAKMGVNLMINLMKKQTDKNIDLLIGPGFYSLFQKRIPDPISNLKEIDDGFASYWGISINYALMYNIPVGKNYVGASCRIFWHPDLTFFNNKNVPEFYNTGIIIGMNYCFNGKK